MISSTVSLKIEELPMRATQITKEALAISGGGECKHYGIGFIRDYPEAQQKCPGICDSNHAKWNDGWKKVIEGKLSYCVCCK